MYLLLQILLSLIVGYFFLNISVIDGRFFKQRVQHSFFHALSDNLTGFENPNAKQGNSTIAIYRNESDSPQSTFTISKINHRGNSVREFTINQADVKDSKGRSSKPIEGVLTHPTDGAFFIVYPTLGRKIFMFDEAGNFIWQMPESRYLEAFAHGNYLMGVSGDHSRANFYNTNLKSQIDVEGHIMLAYQLANKKARPNEYDVCLAFLGGDIAFINIGSKKVSRINSKFNIKSISCDLNTGDFIVQALMKGKEKNKMTDAILAANISEGLKKNVEFEMKAKLSAVQPVTLPLVYVNTDFSAYYDRINSKDSINLITDEGIQSIDVSSFVKVKKPLDSIQALRFQNKAIFWNEHSVMIVDKNGLFLNPPHQKIQKVLTSNTNLIIQTQTGVHSFTLSI